MPTTTLTARPSDATLARCHRLTAGLWIAADSCECRDGAEREACRACRGSGLVEVTYAARVVGDPCDADGHVAGCRGECVREEQLSAWELLALDGAGTDAERAEAAELVAALEWIEAREPAAPSEPAIAAE